MAFAISILESKPSFMYFSKYEMVPSIRLRVASMHTILDCNFLLTIFIENKISCQTTIPTKNSKFSSASREDGESRGTGASCKAARARQVTPLGWGADLWPVGRD